MRKKTKIITVIVALVLVAALSVGGYTGYELWKENEEYKIGDREYEKIQDMVRKKDTSSSSDSSSPKTSSAADAELPKIPQVAVPDLGLDWDALLGVNTDSIAWLYNPDTVIDYPVMKSDNYDQYLHYLPDGTYNLNGTLFFDYNCASDLSDRLSIIYGHHMKSGKMFGTLVGYKAQDYFEAHPYMYLYTKEKNYRIDLLYGFVIAAGEWRNQGYMYPKNIDKLLAYAKTNTTFTSTVNYDGKSRFLAMSTCSYEFDDARYVVIGVLAPEYSE